ncbi:DM13 domain-containing protein [Patescibacteria group bacterium]|nr:DM13 domain-containing protein [Patescibacteria group bacterium]MBP9710271.1 DM13 domain-containing protein [Patescibacteria group bacterium]
MNISTSKIVITLAAIGGIAYLLFGFFGIQALFMDRVVNEEVPLIAMEEPSKPIPSEASTSTPAKTDPASPTSPTPQPSQPPPPQIPKPTSPTRIAQGTFAQGDSTYSIKGDATITEKDGIRTVSLTNFDVTNGPDLFVYVVQAPNAENQIVKDAVQQKQFINLGTLKGNKGNQAYTLPSDLVLDKDSLITIWCRRFSRHFGSADLTLTP